VGRDPPLHLDIVWLLMSRSPETVSARMIFGRNVLHIALHVKKVTERLINLLLDTVHEELLQQMADNGMAPLHLACLHQNDAVILSVLNKYAGATK